MLRKLLITSAVVLLGSIAAFAQSSTCDESKDKVNFDKVFEHEPTIVEKFQRDWELGRDLQRENDRQNQEQNDFKTDIGKTSIFEIIDNQ
jgi:hypothetical protein